MFIELVDSLRCLEPHEDTWLVAAVTRMEGRHVVDGTLGCPVCRREYAVRNGSAWFTATQSEAGAPRLTKLVASDEAPTMRAAALLGLTEPGGIVALDGAWASCADAIAELGVAHVIVLNTLTSDSSPQEVSSLVVDDRLPFGSGALRGVAVGRELATTAMLASAAAALRSRGRLVAPADVPVPDGVDVLARDDADWVGERGVVASPPVALRSARR